MKRGSGGNSSNNGFDPNEIDLAIRLSLASDNTTTHVVKETPSLPPLNKGRVLVNRLQHDARCSGTTFDELIQLPDGRRPDRALVTSFNEDLQWIFEKFCVRKGGCELTIITSDPTPTPLRVQRNVTLYGPPSGTGHSIMHVKLMVLRFPDRARIVVSTNNANSFEWSGIGLMCWTVDLPLLESSSSLSLSSYASPGGEGAVLRDFLVERMKWNDTILRGIDFSHMPGTFVPSWPGALETPTGAGGFPRLRAKAFSLVPDLGKRCTAVTFFTSSMGNITRAFLAQFPCCGITNIKKKAAKEGSGVRIAVCYHTVGDVERANKRGLEGEGLICFNVRFARNPGFCRELLHRVVWKEQARAPALSHVKMIVWSDKAEEPLLVYVGSHNLSGSAWGYGRSGSVQGSNYELGVLLRDVPRDAIPFVLSAPSYSYSAEGGDKPWTMSFE